MTRREDPYSAHEPNMTPYYHCIILPLHTQRSRWNIYKKFWLWFLSSYCFHGFVLLLDRYTNFVILSCVYVLSSMPIDLLIDAVSPDARSWMNPWHERYLLRGTKNLVEECHRTFSRSICSSCRQCCLNERNVYLPCVRLYTVIHAMPEDHPCFLVAC